VVTQGYDSVQAAMFGVYHDGKSGDIEVESTGYHSLIASDIINSLGAA